MCLFCKGHSTLIGETRPCTQNRTDRLWILEGSGQHGKNSLVNAYGASRPRTRTRLPLPYVYPAFEPAETAALLFRA